MKQKYLLLGVTSAIVLFLDQVTKYWINLWLTKGATHPILAGLFDIVHVRNKGAAFGMFASLPDSVRVPLFYITSLIALTLLVLYVVSLKEERGSPYVAIGLILGGALGNVLDRLLRGEVIDFLSLHWYDAWVNWHLFGIPLSFKLEWPAFNVADSAITIAVVWMFLDLFFSQKRTS